MNLLYGKWTVGFFSLASQAGALRPHEALMLLLLYSKPILRKKDCFAVYCCLFICIFFFPCSTAIATLLIYLFIFHLFILIFFLIDLLPPTVNQSGDGG